MATSRVHSPTPFLTEHDGNINAPFQAQAPAEPAPSPAVRGAASVSSAWSDRWAARGLTSTRETMPTRFTLVSSAITLSRQMRAAKIEGHHHSGFAPHPLSA